MSTKSKRTRRPARQQAARADGVIDELRRRYDELTQSQKRIAEYIVDNPEAVAFSTVDQMASALGVNPSTIVRFAYRLGLKGYPNLQENVRQMVRGRLSTASDIVNDKSVLSHLDGTIFGASLSQDLQNMHRTIAALNTDDLAAACRMIAEARRVFVTGAFASYAVAYYLALAIDRIHGSTTLWGGYDSMLPSQSLDLSDQDCLVAFSSPPYAVATHQAAQLAKEAGSRVIAVSDTPISAVGQLADVVIPAHSAGAGAQNSLVAPMAVADALLNGVAGANSARTLERYGRLNRLMNRMDTFLLKGDNGE